MTEVDWGQLRATCLRWIRASDPSCVSECCFTEAAQAIGSAYQETHRRPNETLWRLVAKVHKKTVPLLEKYAASVQQPVTEGAQEGYASGSQELHVLSLSVLELINATGISDSAERSRWLERLLRGFDNEENDDSGASADVILQATNVRGAEEACSALRTFSCSAVVNQLALQNTQALLVCHLNSLEGALKRTSEDDAMQVDLPPSRDGGASKFVKTVLKGRETALRSLLHAGAEQNKDQPAETSGSQIFKWPSLGKASIKEHPHDSSDDFTLHPLLQKIRQSLLSPTQQHALLQSPASGLGPGSGSETAKDRTTVHLLRFCAGTAAVLPHHKLATLRAEAAAADRVPTDWLDLTSVAHSYKLDAHSSQSSCKASVSHGGTQGAPQAELVAGSHSGASGPGQMNQNHQRAGATVSPEAPCQVVSAHDVKASGGCPALGSNKAHLPSKGDHLGGSGAAAIVTENPALGVPLRHNSQAALQGPFARSTSMRNLRGSSDDKHDLPSTPVPASKLPQCGTGRLLGPVSSPAGSQERSLRGGSVSAVTHSLVRRSSRPDSSRGSLFTDAQ
ncbi:hypothetical protein ACSSS7_002983 [Eimeria intestinalis]